MKEATSPVPIVRNDTQAIHQLYAQNVIPSYGRFDLALSHGAGARVWDMGGRQYLDLAGGIAVCSLGHANPEITRALVEQSQRLLHVSNLYYTEPQARLAEKLVKNLGPGKVFFCNSGAEANEGLYKVARKFGNAEGRFEILTALNSFHGRTLAGISATGQEKVKKGFEPMVSGFRHIPFNDLEAARNALSPATVAILIEPIQGETGITPATVDYLLGLRQLCDDHKLLLLLDEVQGGIFRTGKFASYQRILESEAGAAGFMPDAVSLAKSLGGGFPIGAFWVREPYSNLLSAGTHGTTFGGNPLGAAVALRVLEVIERDNLADRARQLGEWMKSKLLALCGEFPTVLKTVRGYGMMIGIELADNIQAFSGSEKTASIQFINKLHDAGVMAVPSGANIIRLLPPLNLSESEADEGLRLIRSVAQSLSQQ
ncbi:MAG TPA: aspartate aminotransferase family protein [Methylomirabilota bacterium]|nr:aspartate aminotransferase family protein [Methylomirabilota bacterium]